MAAWLQITALLEKLLPDGPGGKPSWLYVVLCLLVPAVIGVVMATGIAWLEKLARKRGEHDGDA